MDSNQGIQSNLSVFEETPKNIPKLTLASLISEMCNVLNCSAIKHHEDAEILLEEKFEQIIFRDGREALSENECGFYNLVLNLITPDGEVNEWVLEYVKNFSLEGTSTATSIISFLHSDNVSTENEEIQKRLQLQQEENELQNKELKMDIELLQRELCELQQGRENNPNQSNQEVQNYLQQVQEMEKKNEEKIKSMEFGFSLQDLKNEMECQACREEFVPYEYEPDWGKIEETRYNISARKQKSQEWRQNVRSRFYTRFDCKYGCSGVCFSCAEMLWKQAGEIARKNRVKTRYCPYCKHEWKTKPEPFVAYVRG